MPAFQIQPELGQVVRQLRGERQHSSQAELASAAGVSVGVIERLESGKDIRTDNLASVAAALDSTIDDLRARAVQLRIANGASSEAGRRQPVAYGLAQDELTFFFEGIDSAIGATFGALYSPTQSSLTEFSSRKLFSSLAVIGIPPEIALEIISSLPRSLEKAIKDGNQFSTGHIRLAVAQAISSIPGPMVLRSEPSSIGARDAGDRVAHLSADERKFDWVKRYCRRYGDPSQTIKMVEDDGSFTPIDFSYLKTIVVPHMLKRLLGEQFNPEQSPLVSATSVAEMAGRLLEEFRRLNLYSIRYRTALWLAEEIAIQPPHPWLVTPETRASTVAYDLERAQSHLAAIKHPLPSVSNEHWHRYTEVIHHCCSAILGNYGGFIGHKYLFPLHVLKHWLSIRDTNIALWSFCELQMIYSDCQDLGVSHEEFSALLKRIEVVCNSRKPDEAGGHVKNAERLFQLARALVSCRERMRARKARFETHGAGSAEDILLLARDAIVSVFRPAKAKPITNRHSGRQIGWSCNVDLTKTALAKKGPLCLFIVNTQLGNKSGIATMVSDAIDAVHAHRFSDLSFLIVRSSDIKLAKRNVDEIQAAVGSDKIVIAVTVDKFFAYAQKEDAIEKLFEDLLSV